MNPKGFPEPNRGLRCQWPGEPEGRDGPPFQPTGQERDRPDRVAERRETGKILEEALSGIDPDSRRLLLLSDVEGFTYEEVAAMAEIPVGTVKSRIHRARMALRRILAPVA
jgi:RNA polymerase sigma-70 factor (ECF subfamily)